MMHIPSWLETLGSVWNEPLYLVGGLVRNWLLGIDYGDIDLASVLTPAEVTALLSPYPQYSVIPKKPQLGTIEIHLHQDGHTYIAEHTTFRRDVYFDDGSHNPKFVEFSDTLQEDAFRRDFTVNALYLNVLTQELTDPTGGLSDLKNKLLRATSPHPEIILQDDALRILRLVRFAAMLDFTPEAQTLKAAKMFAPNLKDISAERRAKEFIGLLLCDKMPYTPFQNSDALYKSLQLLHTLGAWRYVLSPAAYNKKNIEKCCSLPPDTALRLGALLPDSTALEPALGGSGLKLFNDLNILKKIVALKELSKCKKEVFLPALALAPRNIAEKTALLYGGKISRYLTQLEETHAPRSYAELALSSSEIIQLTDAKGPQIGQLQQALFAYAVMNPKRNRKKALENKAIALRAASLTSRLELKE